MQRALRSRALALLIALPSAGSRAAAPVHSPVAWRVKNPPAHALKTGVTFDLVVEGKIEPGWHVYALEEPDGGPIATTVSLAEGDPADVEQVSEEKPRIVPDAAFGRPTGLFEGTAEFTLHSRIARDAAAGAHTLHVLVRYQSCSGSLCLPPHQDILEVPVTVAR